MSALPGRVEPVLAGVAAGGFEPGHYRAEEYWTSLRYFGISRLAISGLVAALVPLQEERLQALADLQALQFGALVYVLAAVALLALIEPLRPRFNLQFAVQVTVDIVAVAYLTHVAGGVSSGFGVLFVAPVAGAAILGSRRLALLFAAIATLALLGETGWRFLVGADADWSGFMHAGLTGALVFAGAWLVGGLASRLRREADLASVRALDLRNQFAVNQLVISELADGVLVVDSCGAPVAMNRAAQQLLGLPLEAGAQPCDPSALADCGAWRAVSALWRDWQARRGSEPEHDLDADLPAGPGSRHHRVRIRLLAPGVSERGDTVIVLEDLDRVEERAEQLKLASMGRLSAAIAHEVRNPLGAIRHANGLLCEQLRDARLQRLAEIVEDNSVRINRIVEDVLSIARRERPLIEKFGPGPLIEETVAEVLALAGERPERITISVASEARIRFDPNQLRQVLINLLSNALRHASPEAGSVRIDWREDPEAGLELAILDDGPGVPAQTLQHVFEPFFTTQVRGTGLGLFLARELCNLNDATLRYRPLADGGRYRSAFVIVPSRGQPAT
ncbi:MAG: two-component sensor histidine kinase [Burkholderiales bacterium]|nr:MAG: two-component sensor histidine kinase [Burkholderiales bacterium]